jgi:hypothetical protein
MDDVAWTRHAEDTSGDFLDKIGMRPIGPEQDDITLQSGAHGFEGRYLLLQLVGAFDQSRSRLETVFARDRMMDEVGL